MRLRGEPGQGTIEYLAVVLVVAGVMTAAIGLLAFPGLGGKVVDAFHRALCVVTGGACDRAAAVIGPCVLSSEQHADGGHFSVLMLHSGERDVVLRERRSDGTVALTLVDGDTLGPNFGSGAGARVRWGERTWAVGGELRAAVLAGADSGRTWIVHNDAQAAQTFDHIEKAAAFNGLGGDRRIAMPRASVTFTERSSNLHVDFQAGGRAAISLSAQDAYGERFDHRTGRRTVYVRDALGARGRVSYARTSAAGEGYGEERVAITYDRSGRPIDFMVLSILDVEGAVGLPPRLARLAGRLRVNGSRHIETEQHLDLTNPENAEIAQAILGAAGDDRLGSRLAAEALRERLDEEASLGVRSYETDASTREVSGQVKVAGIGVGAGVGSTDESARLVGALSRQRDGSFAPDEDCRPA